MGRHDGLACTDTMEARSAPEHVHTCAGHSMDGDHYCDECGRFWWQRSPEVWPVE